MDYKGFRDGKPFLLTNFLYQLLSNIILHAFTRAQIFDVLDSFRQEKWVICYIDFKAMEYKLRISDTCRFLTDLIREDKAFYEGNECVHQEVVRTVLNLFIYDTTSNLMNNFVNIAISLMTRLHRAIIHSFYDSRLRIQKGTLAEVSDCAKYLTTEGPVIYGVFGRIFIGFLQWLRHFLIKLDVFENKHNSLHGLVHQRALQAREIKTWLNGSIQFFQLDFAYLCQFLSFWDTNFFLSFDTLLSLLVVIIVEFWQYLLANNCLELLEHWLRRVVEFVNEYIRA